MPHADVYDITGQKTGTIDLPEAIFGIRPHRAVIHEVLVAQLAGRRAGTQSTKTRGEVSGSTRKIYRQKGTGRARHGSRKAPIFKGGGITFGPKPRSYDQATPKRVKRLAIRSTLSAKAAAGEILVVDSLAVEPAKTSALATLLRTLPVKGKALLVTTPDGGALAKIAGNIPDVKVLSANGLNVHDLIRCDVVILTRPAVAAVGEVLQS